MRRINWPGVGVLLTAVVFWILLGLAFWTWLRPAMRAALALGYAVALSGCHGFVDGLVYANCKNPYPHVFGCDYVLPQGFTGGDYSGISSHPSGASFPTTSYTTPFGLGWMTTYE